VTVHVLLISLGPVQDFIAAARRCRDLWFGSWVLSELAKATAAGVVDGIAVEGGERAALESLVFPAPAERRALDPGSEMSVANKLVARVTGDAARAGEVAEKGCARMRERLAELRDDAFERIGKNDERRGDHFLVERARQQVDELFEVVWVAVPEVEGEAGYADARLEAERLLAARKNARTWAQPPWARDGVRKSSIDGVHESVLHEDVYRKLMPEERREGYGVRGAERLCGAGLLKRWGVQQGTAGGLRVERFFSTAHLAALPLMLGIAADVERAPELDDAWRALRRAAEEAAEELDVVPGRRTGLFGRTDGAILFATRLGETLADLGHDRESDVARNAFEKQSRFLRLAGRGEPIPYYAILVADGDGMGALIGERRGDGAHRDLSRALDGFAGSARGIVRDHEGCLIYSGGDDVLAFLPLHRAIECAHLLAQRFRDVIAGGSLSAGLAVVHYVDPMGAALEIARGAEKIAKGLPGKDALAVALDKRSGETTVVCDHWDSLAPRLRHLVALHRADAIPDKAGHELAELSRLGEGLREIQGSEALRILRRKRAKHGKEPLAKTALEWLEQHLGDPGALGDEIAIARLIARAKVQAAHGDEEGA
jgi:CRISPR-associated protein Cmr2